MARTYNSLCTHINPRPVPRKRHFKQWDVFTLDNRAITRGLFNYCYLIILILYDF